jgi:hypothetical protein
MAYSVVDTPPDYSSAHGDIICTVYDDNYTQVNYRYVANVYVGDDLITRLKSVPDPVTGLGIFNFGMIYRNYVNSNLYGVNFSAGNLILNSLYYYALEMHIEWGYEYGTSLENNDIGIETTRGINITNHYNGRLFGTNKTILQNYSNNALSNRPYETSMYNAIKKNNYTYDHKFLVGFWYNYDAELRLDIRLISYNSSNVQTGISFFSVGTSEFIKFYELDLSPSVLNDYANIINSSTKYITIRLQRTEVSTGDQYDVLKDYKINLKCENRYNPITLVWLNKLGTYDSFTFPKVSKKSYNVTKKNYNQLEYFIDDYDGKAKYFNGDIGNDNKPTYNVNFKESRILNTDIIDEATYAWLNELLISPLVYMQSDYYNVMADTDTSNYLIPITITDSTFNFKTKAVERQFNLTLKIEFGDTLNAQYR